MPRLEKIRRPWEPEPAPKPQPQQGRKADTSDYHTSAWRKCSEMHRRHNPFCVMCLEEDIQTDCSPGLGTGVTDHVHPVAKGGAFWDPRNWQTLCNRHHNSKSAKDK
jgi:5-methylcytosine-specific restriction endonuclease McrA